MTNNPPRLLVVDDDREIAALVSKLAEKAGFAVSIAEESREVRESPVVAAADVIVLDLQMPGLDGVQVLRVLAERGVQAAIIIVSGMDERTRMAAERYGKQRGLNVLTTVEKPFFPEEFLQLLSSAYDATAALGTDDLETAIAEEQLFVLYQPTVSRFGASTWRISGMEALLRWDHPTRGVLGPEHFLTMGEDSGLIRPITDFVIQRGLEQLKAWQSAHIGLALRLNVSAMLLTDVDFPDRLELLISELNLDPADITLEISETAALDGHPDTFDILTRFRLKNINLAMDDFGTGDSSLTQLFRMPFNEMKIDRSLLADVTSAREANILVKALVALGHNLGLTVCAEGVETEDVLSFLSEIECDLAQGYFISHPLAPKAVLEMVQKNRDLTERHEPVHAWEI